MKNFVKKNWFGLLTITVSLAALIIAIFVSGNREDFFNAVKHLDKMWMLAAFAVIIIYWMLDALVLNIITSIKYKKYKFRKSFQTGMIGLLYSALTPFATGGQPMQIYEMTKTGILAGDAGSIITVKSIIYQTVMTFYAVFVFIFSSSFFLKQIDNFVFFMIWGFLSNILFISVVVFICFKQKFTKSCARLIILFLSKIRIIKNFDNALEKTYDQMKIFHDSVLSLKGNVPEIIKAIVVSIAQLTFFYAIPYCIYRGFHLSDASLFLIIAANSLISMIAAFFPLPGATGAAEGSFYLFFSMFFTKKLVLFATLIWRVVTYYSCIICGVGVSLVLLLEKKRKNMPNKPKKRMKKEKIKKEKIKKEKIKKEKAIKPNT